MGGGGDHHGGGGHGHGHGHGGEAGDFRKKVWSMTGGPYCRPKHWRRNTAIALAGIFLICVPIAMKSAELKLKKATEAKAKTAPIVSALHALTLTRAPLALLTSDLAEAVLRPSFFFLSDPPPLPPRPSTTITKMVMRFLPPPCSLPPL
ncbi:uncharacterized protein LOC109725262 isoform X1 [Ananas comosus]|uniref:Uncharacterized protein LOC109725262 isoform X1 n=1 Tax=Ananas comosus TaxID=4615 RepID=A0A6P5GPY7_ANACO|nr:uncharacterized protein LOC109725262 isoform X1 [Ananas comosus]